MKYVTAICGTCDAGVESVLFSAGVEHSFVSPWAIRSHAEQHGHTPQWYRFIVVIPHRQEVS